MHFINTVHRILFKKQISFKDFVMTVILKVKSLICYASASLILYASENSSKKFSLKQVPNSEKRIKQPMQIPTNSKKKKIKEKF